MPVKIKAAGRLGSYRGRRRRTTQADRLDRQQTTTDFRGQWHGAPWGVGAPPWRWGAPPRPAFSGPLPPAWGPPPPPFDYWGYTVTPVWDPGFNQWGFWLFGVWIPL